MERGVRGQKDVRKSIPNRNNYISFVGILPRERIT